MAGFVEGVSRDQATLFPERLDELIAADGQVRVVDAFVDRCDLRTMGFTKAVPASTGRPAYDPAAMAKLYVYGYLHQVRSSRRLERECHRNIEVLWLLNRLAPDFKTIAEFRRVNREALGRVELLDERVHVVAWRGARRVRRGDPVRVRAARGARRSVLRAGVRRFGGRAAPLRRRGARCA